MDAPRSSIELYDDATLADAVAAFRELRALGSTVYLERYAIYAHPRFDECHAALRDWRTYSSASGVMMNDAMNETLRGILLCSDGEEHAAMRRVIAAPLTPQRLADVREEIEREAESLVERLVAQGTFDAATELAHHLPVTIVSSRVGLPEEGRERMIEWAHANFDCFGPMNSRTEAAFPVVEEMVEYAFTQCVPGKLKSDGWAQGIWDAAARGEIPSEKPPLMMNDYMGPSLDTTIFAIGSMIRLFADHPEQWTLLRERPDLTLNAINEVLRLEAVITGFSRVLTRDHHVDGADVPEGARVLVLYASANRDERKFPEPDEFDITRSNAGEHLGLGFGPHACPGGNLAKLEMRALLDALRPRVERFELHEFEPKLNNVLHGPARCLVSVR